jgi:hypothetical protein
LEIVNPIRGVDDELVLHSFQEAVLPYPALTDWAKLLSEMMRIDMCLHGYHLPSSGTSDTQDRSSLTTPSDGAGKVIGVSKSTNSQELFLRTTGKQLLSIKAQSNPSI